MSSMTKVTRENVEHQTGRGGRTSGPGAGMLRTVKKIGQRILRVHPALYTLGSKMYHRLHRGFVTLSPGSPQAIEEALERSQHELVGEAGDYYEFGLFRGYTFWSAQDACRRLGLKRLSFYGFDSFQGLPEVEGEDRAGELFFRGQFKCGKDQVEAFLSERGVDWSRTHLIEGFYSDSLNDETRQRYPFRPVTAAFIDCDLYSSTREVLSWLSDLIVDGSILLFDDWRSFGNESAVGQPKAFREFLEARPHLRAEPYLDFSYHGRGFVIRAQSAESAGA